MRKATNGNAASGNANDSRSTFARATTQTVRLNGVRTIIRTSATGKVTTKAALPQEWELQAAQVRRLRAMPEYGKQFLLAGDMNAERRGPRARAIAIATGMTSGEADLRIYLFGGEVRMIENKAGKGRLSPEQKARHAALAILGHHVEVVRAETTTEAADRAQALVRQWIAENDNTHATIATSETTYQ